VSGTLTARIVGGVLELCGANAIICAALLPAGVQVWDHEAFVAVGTDQATAYPITKPSNAIIITSTAGAGVRLPVSGTGPNQVTLLNVSATKTFKVYPAAGDAFIPGFVANASIDLAPETQLFLQRVATNQWMVEVEKRTVTVPPPPPPTTGTVESVDIGTSSSGLSVGGGPVTVTGTLTVDLHADLEQLVGFPSADAILAGDGAGNWTPVAIGDWLNFAGGVLDVVPPTGDNQQVVGTTFSITAASGTYQATGTTIALATAGTYLITGKIRGTVLPGASTSHFITAKLRDITNAADIANSETLVCYSDASGQADAATAGFTARVIAAGAVTLEVYAFRSGTTFTLSDVCVSDANGRTVFNVTRLE
jgi:hypothetical protein